ncbi:hypothetical protein OH492_13075 [Vibrio chagasii]|nr:hypothetical protein [Vibrio chagasii]
MTTKFTHRQRARSCSMAKTSQPSTAAKTLDYRSRACNNRFQDPFGSLN